jgi:glycine betaine/proline transport system ATP-binding protein
MEGGRIVQCGTPQDIIANPANAYVEDFVTHMNPLNVLLASDVMSKTLAQQASVQVHPDTPVNDVIQTLSGGTDIIGVKDGETDLGSITNQDIISALHAKNS